MAAIKTGSGSKALLTFRNALFKASREIEGKGQVCARVRRKRIQVEGRFDVFNRLIGSPAGQETPCVPLPSGRVAWIKLNRRAELMLGARTVAHIVQLDKSKCRVSLCQRTVDAN